MHEIEIWKDQIRPQHVPSSTLAGFGYSRFQGEKSNIPYFSILLWQSRMTKSLKAKDSNRNSYFAYTESLKQIKPFIVWQNTVVIIGLGGLGYPGQPAKVNLKSF